MTLSKISKTTVNGYLVMFISIGSAIMAINSPLIPQRVGLWLTLTSAVARVIVGHAQADADLVTAKTPDAGVQVVAAHPVPDNPRDIV